MLFRSAIYMKLTTALLLSCGIQCATAQETQDAAAIVRRALVENMRDLKTMRNYIYLSDSTVDTLDNDNQVKKSTSQRKELFYLDGSPFERILLQDGKPLSEKEQAKQEARLDSQIKDAQSASPKYKEEREKKAAKAIEEEIALRKDVADGFVFTIAAEELRNGDKCIKLNAEPKQGFKGKSLIRALLPFLHGSIWIDVDKDQWVDIDAMPTRKLGKGIVYINDQSAIHLHQEPVREGVWVMTKEDIHVDARLLWDKKNVHIVRTCGNFRKFTSEVRILPAGSEASGPAQSPK